MSTTPTPENIQVALRLGEAFDGLGIGYMICGSMASSLHGEPRTTYDLDVVTDLRRAQIDDLCRELASDFVADRAAIEMAVDTCSSCNILHTATVLKVDLFVLKPRAFSREEFARRQAKQAIAGEKRVLSVASVEDMVLTKLEWYRKGDCVSDRQWRDVIGMIKLRGEDIDHAYLDRWAPELGVEDLLRRAREETRDSRR